MELHHESVPLILIPMFLVSYLLVRMVLFSIHEVTCGQRPART